MLETKEAKELASGKSRRLVAVTPETSVKRAIQTMRESDIRHLVVLKDGKCSGIVCVKDLIADAAGADWFGSGRTPTVAEIMRINVPIIDEHTDIKTALSFMLKNGLTALPLSQEGKITGIITETDMLRLLDHLVEKHTGLRRALDRGEAAVTSPLVQNLMRALGDAGI